MKWNLQFILKKKIKGVTLLELIISIGLTSLIILSLVNLMSSSTDLVEKLNEKNEVAIDLEFALDYMIQEIDSSDLIITEIPDWLSRDSLKIELVKTDENKQKLKYNQIVYMLNDDEIIRYTSKSSKISKNKRKSAYQGRNTLIKGVETFTTSFDKENKMLTLILETEDKKIERSHYIRGVYYED